MSANQLQPEQAGSRQDFMDTFDLLHDMQTNRNLTNGALAIGSSSKAKILIANACTVMIDGVLKSVASAEVAFTAGTHDITADADTIQERIYVVYATDTNTTAIIAGDQADVGEARIPDVPDGGVALGYLKLQVAAGSTDFDATTDELDEAHLTDTYVNLGVNPNLGKFSGDFEPGL